MDLALRFVHASDDYDISLDAPTADLTREDGLTTAVLLSLLTDRTAQASDVAPGEDRRGWWADAYALAGDKFGSRLWLLARGKQLPAVMQSARAYIEEALAWLVEDGFATSVKATVFAPRRGWLAAEVAIALNGDSRRLRFDWDDANQVWRLNGELS